MPLELTDVSFAYGAGQPWEQLALFEVTLAVSPGELLLVVGPTGSGKSTLLRIAAGLLEPRSGSVALDGERMISSARGARVGIAFQDAESQLFAETILDDVSFGPMNLGASKSEAAEMSREALHAVGLEPALFSQRSPFSLSGGEARRVAIAGVLSMRPEYLLFDEVTAGLDASGRATIKALLADLRLRTGIIVVTHDAEDFLPSADRVLVLLDGRSAFYGPVSSLLQAPEVLAGPGLRPPPLLDVQMRLRRLGLDSPVLSLDPAEAALGIARALAEPGCRQ